MLYLILPESLLGAADHIAQQYCRWANGILITKGAKQLTLLYLSQFSKWCCQYALTTKPSMQFLFIWSYWLLCILYHQIYSCWLTIVPSHQSQILIWRCPNPIIHIDPASINSCFKTFDDSVQLSVGENVLNNQHKLHSCVSAPQKKKKNGTLPQNWMKYGVAERQSETLTPNNVDFISSASSYVAVSVQF